ncbi:MAG: site-specific integrase [Chloroflexi bacterium]|nr:site-specific integrase [Chloroflexota bacterium]
MPLAADVLDKMWRLDSFRDCSPYGMRDVGATQNARKLLLTSLKTHTIAKVRWDALNEWEQAWDKCESALKQLQQETRNVMHNIIEQKQLSQKLKKGSKEKDIIERMVNRFVAGIILGEVSVTRSLHHLRDGSIVFRQPKTAKGRRTVALPPSATLLLTEHREKQKLERVMLGIPLTDGDLVFSHLDGKPIRPNTVTRAWTILAARAGVKVIRLHDARHTHASLMPKQGIHPKVVQERLGHSSIQITLDTYSHVTPGLQEAAAKRFDEAFTTKYNKPENKAVEKFS